MRRHASIILIASQMAVAVAGLLAMALWPPATGSMTIVPIDGADADRTLVRMLDGHVPVMGRGWLPGSLVVRGDRAAIAALFAPGSVVMLAPTPAGCGTSIAAGVTA
ncbi:MAG: hypothetical protein PGN23_03475 [Sphingomonas adhaesiva]|uniref:hypothetical protein n=1 Tax=Sphingomonas adhaesiva TaxID=28212 RepID=UPI002FFC7427